MKKSRFKLIDFGDIQIFEGATTLVKCLICNAVIAEPKGGKAELKAKLIEVLN